MIRMTDNVLSLKPWEAVLRRTIARTADLLSRDDAAAAVQALSPLEAYTAVKSLGPADAGPLLDKMSEEQVQTLWDLEGWDEHRLSVPDVILWLTAFREASIEALQRAAATMDFEALSALLRRRLLVGLKPSEDRSDEDPVPLWMMNPSPDIEPLVETPDGRFIIAARIIDEDEVTGDPIDEEDRKWILGFVSELYRQEDWEDIAGVLRSAAYDLTSSLEEDAYRFRSGRLEDLGFPPRERAIEIYGLVDPDKPMTPVVAAPSIDLNLPATYLPPLRRGLFHAAMDAIDDPALMRRLEGDLVAVANKALVADGVAPGQVDQMQDVLHRLRGYVELALGEGVAAPLQTETAIQRLRESHLERLFRIGYTLTVRAAGRVRRILERPELGDGSRDLALRRLSTAEQGVAEALLLRRPRVSGALEPIIAAVAEGELGASPMTGSAAGLVSLDDGAAEIRRPFLSLADLDAVRWVLTDLERFLDAWAQQPPGRPSLPDDLNLPLEERTIDVELATALANVLLGRPYAIAPLADADLADLADLVKLDDQQKPRFHADKIVAAVQAAGGPAVHGRVHRVLSGLCEQLWTHVGQDQIDPRFMDGVLTVTDGKG